MKTQINPNTKFITTNRKWQLESIKRIEILEEIIKELENLNTKFPKEYDTRELKRIENLIPVTVDDKSVLNYCKSKLQYHSTTLYELAKKGNLDMKKIKGRIKNKFGYMKPTESNINKTNISTTTVYPKTEYTSTKSLAVPDFRKEMTPHDNYVKIVSNDSKCDYKPELIISRLAYSKIMTFTKLVSTEIEGLGIVEQISNEEFYIEDIYLFNQIVSGAQCEPKDDMALIDLCERLRKEGKKSSQLKCWWHSHNSMGTSPSSTDKATAKNFASDDFFIWFITNHQGDFNAKINIYKPVEMVFSDVPVFVKDIGVNQEFIDSCKEEIKKYVLEETYQTTTYPKQGYIGFEHYGLSGYMPANSPLIDDRSEGLVTQNDDHLENLPVGDVPEIPSTELETEAPFGKLFYDTDKGIKYVWDYVNEKYLFYDMMSNYELDEKDLERRNGQNYNLLLQNKKGPETQEGA